LRFDSARSGESGHLAISGHDAMTGHEQRPGIRAERSPNRAAGRRRIAQRAGDVTVAARAAGFYRQSLSVNLAGKVADLGEVIRKVAEILEFSVKMPFDALDDGLNPLRWGVAHG